MYQIQIKKFDNILQRFKWEVEKTNGVPDKFDSMREAIFIVDTVYPHIRDEHIKIVPTRFRG